MTYNPPGGNLKPQSGGSINLSQNFLMAPELIAAMTGSSVLVGILLYNPITIIFDNQSTSTVTLQTYMIVNGSEALTTWHTFPAGEAIVLDLRENHGIAVNGTFPIGMPFFATGINASGNFSISYTYAQGT